MKKIFSALILISFLAILMVPSLASAQELKDYCNIDDYARLKITCGDTINPCSYSETNCGMCCLLNTLYNVTDWIFAALVAVAGILVILGAFNIVTAGGSSDKVASGRNYIIYAAVGLAVGLLARAIPAIVRMIVGA